LEGERQVTDGSRFGFGARSGLENWKERKERKEERGERRTKMRSLYSFFFSSFLLFSFGLSSLCAKSPGPCLVEGEVDWSWKENQQPGTKQQGTKKAQAQAQVQAQSAAGDAGTSSWELEQTGATRAKEYAPVHGYQTTTTSLQFATVRTYRQATSTHHSLKAQAAGCGTRNIHSKKTARGPKHQRPATWRLQVRFGRGRIVSAGMGIKPAGQGPQDFFITPPPVPSHKSLLIRAPQTPLHVFVRSTMIQLHG
jgi:hypothetical protein